MRALVSQMGRNAARLTQRFIGEKSGNIAIIFGLSAITLLSAAGGALDWSRAMVTKTRLGTALDAAALAIGTTNNLTQTQLEAMAQQYFNANYPANTIGTPSPVHVVVNGQTISLSVTATVPTTLLKLASINTLDLSVANQVVRAVTKLRVALVLDNTGSMSQTDGTGTSKMSALKTASHQLLTQLQAAAINPGDVQVALLPFSLDVNVGTGNSGSSWIDWTDWDAPPPGVTPSSNTGPASGYDTCPFTNSANDFKCTNTSSNTANCNVDSNSACVTTIPSSGAMNGKICPSAHQADTATGRGGHYFNGCWDSQSTRNSTTTCTQDDIGGSQNCGSAVIGAGGSYTGDSTSSSNSSSTNTICYHHSYCTCTGYAHCTLTGSGSSKVATQTVTTTTTTTVTRASMNYGPPWSHTWQANSHSSWGGCIMDRTQNYDANNSTPTAGTPASLFPAENQEYCPPALVGGLSYNWTNLSNAVDAMSPNGSTNQTIGFAWGWHALSQGAPLNAPASDNFTSQVIIILSDGLNTQNRWHGDGSHTDSTVDARETAACTNAKAAGVIVYTLFVDLGGTSGNSAPLQSCATDSGKYFDLTTSGAIVTAFNQIGTELANLHLSQ